MSSRGSFRGRGRGGGSNTRFTGKKRSARGGGVAYGIDRPAPKREDDGTAAAEKFEEVKIQDEIDEKLGFWRFESSRADGEKKIGWLVNMHQTLVQSSTHAGGLAAVDFYFIQDDGGMFKATIPYEPYFYVTCRAGTETIVEEWLLKRFEGILIRVEREKKWDLSLPNHLLSAPPIFLKLFFHNTADLQSIRREILPLAEANSAKFTAVDAYADVVGAENAMNGNDDDQEGKAWGAEDEGHKRRDKEPAECIIDIREHDINYYLRVAIDLDVRVGLWYTVTSHTGIISLERITSLVKRAEPVVMAYDIETTKQPLKFPDQQTDQIMMISYMIDGQGYLITNREIVAEDIDDFEYTPKEEYPGDFTIFNEPDEPAVIRRWFEHIRDSKPTVMVTYNGDSFDFPFVDVRAKIHGISMYDEIGFKPDNENEYKCRATMHMDCFRWVKRDSYLPQGSQGLKAVTKAKLGYNPTELDPELMTPYAIEQPHSLAQYSVSDAVATYYLYMKYVHPFIFSLCNIIPLNPDEVLRKGSGTLCETLLMVEAYQAHIIMPNRHEDPHGATYEGHLLASETYVGGHVEALEAGVFRSDIATHFKMEPSACQQLIDDLDAALQFSLVEEGNLKLEDVENYDEVKNQIQSALELMRDNPNRMDKPLIYHLDVAAMYPNIMLSNRLQPDSMKDEAACAVCDYNRPDKTCDRRLEWAWRGEYFPAKRDEVNMVRYALEQETFPPKMPNGPRRRFIDLAPGDQSALIHKRLGDYSRKVYRKTHETKIVTKTSIICQRENSFYIDTVRAFRDRRYEYKGLHKTWKKNLDKAFEEGGAVSAVDEAKKMIVLYDSLQLAHKCILNSFYGYVMRKGARWYSMEMAGITCLTGASIIQMARQLVEQIGRPLELDTDGIWCMLPGVFPEDFKFKLKNGKSFGVSYPCTMLNHLVHAKFTNHQYHELVDKETGKYEVRKENSIFFELDGPYKAMILPSSKEEDKLLKKRYAVFNPDGSLAELKGFEVKRRGELQLIKIFQSQIFDKFLLGSTTEECYAAVAEVADQWLDILQSKASSLHDDELVDLIAENRSMSKTLAEYGTQKSTSISTARRLAEFLGEQMVKDKGLSCRFIISAKPNGAPVTERAIPVAIFTAEEPVKRHFLKKWLKDNSLTDFDLRTILDWAYYTERLGSVIQKLITIPAALQKVANPVPRIRHPDWLFKRVAAKEDKFQQHKLTDMFAKMKTNAIANGDIEDMGKSKTGPKMAVVKKKKVVREKTPEPAPDPTEDYSGYIRVMKTQWRKQRIERARLRKQGLRQDGTVSSMLRTKSVNLASRQWDIIQIASTNRPGEFRLWLAIDGTFQSVRLRIPREFYLNFKSFPVDGTFSDRYEATSVARVLPRGRSARHLFKLLVDEALFVEGESHFSSMINNPNVDGAYELQVPLVVRALLQFGTSCTLKTTSLGGLNRGLDKGFDLSELERPGASVLRHKYLDEGKGIKYHFLYHATFNSRHLIALFSPDSAVKVYIVDSSRTPERLPNPARWYNDRVDKAIKGIFSYSESIEFITNYYKNELSALKALSKDLQGIRHGLNVITLCSPFEHSYYQVASPVFSEFPFITFKGNDEKPSLGWLVQTSRRMINQYLKLSGWIKDQIEIAAHYDVPVGNLGQDAPVFLADIEFARRLKQQDMILWWSASSRPDLGGSEEDANLSEDLITPRMSTKGCYSSVVLEMEIADLAINAVLQSALVNEMEGSGAGSLAFDSASHNLDEYAKGTANTSVMLGDAVLSTQTFGVLKSMVRSWFLDKARAHVKGIYATPADLVVDQFWRWISSSASNMFEPALQRFLHGLMRKTFLQLLAELKRLGTSVVYADFNRIFLLTTKPDAGSAYAFAKYLVTAANSQELFRHLVIDVTQFWNYLAWMDVANFGGVKVPPEVASSRDPPPAKFEISMDWNIQSFLPGILQPIFERNVAQFIYQLYTAKRTSYDERAPLKVIHNLNIDLPGENTSTINPAKEKEKLAGSKSITQVLTRKLLADISAVKKRQALAHVDEEKAESLLFPLLPGSRISTSEGEKLNPTLELIKSITEVYSLASSEHLIEIQILRKNLLDLVGVKEFSQSAQFKNPFCDDLQINLIICKKCNSLRDIDLCRDPDRLPSFDVESGGMLDPPRKNWVCHKCDSEYDKFQIEQPLIEMIAKMITAYQTQDVICMKCSSSKADDLAATCHCGGSFKPSLNKNEMKMKLKMIRSVAQYHDLALVGSYVEEVLSRW
ncbi:DNA polymerase epsilon catalytic subunit A [Kwoniella bestiolae CBS 10118]|uniref:DNA polymerase epsilon catalytic subunit n=1 Tax=Kwoniella bestiolae CBS 10118 TaxID=1296100 RepID=A0A1B9G9U1_9TREE|nr:DNA polymerase epsilon catalytic subunit A [Kwoniella bestiolae CBS 10118]OCF27777.1 DNA polymerase epsilon catalytic subunit A [Kwoniella bestiolae CBS 10118]